MLEIKNVSKQFGSKSDRVLHNVSLKVEEGEFIALLGESGCGKTTLLRIIAGLEEVNEGEVIIDDKMVVSNRLFVQPEKRNVGLVFQNFALFPHLTVHENIAFGLHKIAKSERNERVNDLLNQVNLNKYGHRFPHQLSGGQQQRVALARALAPRPSLLLLDEPFSSLDAVLKEEMRVEVKRIIKDSGTTAVFVTHDIQDALSTADKVAVLKEGYLQQYDSPENLYDRPKSNYTANFMGNANCIEVEHLPNGFKSNFGFIPIDKTVEGKGKIQIVIRPEDIHVVNEEKDSFQGIVKSVAYYGDHQKVKIDCAGTILMTRCAKKQIYKVGEVTHFRIMHAAILEL